MTGYKKVVFYKTYFSEFFNPLSQKIKDKILWTFKLIEEQPKIPETYLKHIINGLYEIRVQWGNDIFRIFCFYDKGQLIVLINAFQKKTQKTPPKEIERALKIKRDYEKEQKSNNS